MALANGVVQHASAAKSHPPKPFASLPFTETRLADHPLVRSAAARGGHPERGAPGQRERVARRCGGLLGDPLGCRRRRVGTPPCRRLGMLQVLLCTGWFASGRRFELGARCGWCGVAARADPTNAERQRRSRERKRFDRTRVTRGVTLSAAADAAEREALAELGSDYERYAAAVRRYVLAVDVAEYARLEWERLERPMRDTFANGMAGVHPVLKAYEQAEAQAARFADSLGLVVVGGRNRTRSRRPHRLRRCITNHEAGGGRERAVRLSSHLRAGPPLT